MMTRIFRAGANLLQHHVMNPIMNYSNFAVRSVKKIRVPLETARKVIVIVVPLRIHLLGIRIGCM